MNTMTYTYNYNKDYNSCYNISKLYQVTPTRTVYRHVTQY